MDNDFNKSQQPGNEKQVDRALKHVRTLSQMAARDAGYVTEAIDGENKGGIHLSQNLYVTRTIEAEIHKRLDTSAEEELLPLLISGEAGFGKTSLLWHLYHTLQENNSREIWLIKSTFLTPFISPTDSRDFPRSSSHVTVANLITAVEAVQQQKKPVLLLDTVDLLLHNERDRDNLLGLLSGLRESGCRVIVTSRPQEAIHLHAHVDHPVVGLQAYDQQELEIAVSNHVQCFYARADTLDMAEHLERILNAVSNGLPIREVCTNPLTLRMLFILYAPEPVSLEINTFQLYQKFWELRITKDHRAGSSYSSGENLGNAASIVALSMLVEGTPELTGRLLERYLKDWYGDHRNFTLLISRGVIHRSEDDTIRFFHQTFFEHCAARGLLSRFKHKAILLLQDRMKANPNDLFVSPIMEQTLLLVEDDSRQLRTMGDDALLELLKSHHQLLKTSGIYVYIHRRKIDNKVEDEVRNLLASKDNAVLNRFLSLAPNMPQSNHRCKTLFKELEIAWQADTTEARNLVLELLERLATRFPGYVEHFLKSQGILDFAPQQWVLGFKKILNILVVLFQHFPSSRQKEVVQQLTRLLKQKGTDALSNRIMEALLDISLVSHYTTIADECEAALKSPGKRVDKIRKTVLAKLFYHQWKYTGTPIETIFAGLKEKNPYFFKARLLALSEFLLNAKQEEAAKAWRHFINETDDFKKWMWAHMVIPKLIAGFSNDPFERRKAQAAPSETAEPALFIREKIKEIFSYWSSNLAVANQEYGEIANSPDTFQKVRKALIFANPGNTIFMDIINSPALVEPSPWCDPDLFGELLADAYNMGHPGAVKAMQLLVNNIENYPERLLGIVGCRLINLAIQDDWVIETSFSFYLQTRNANLMQIFLEANKSSVLSIIPRWRKNIDHLLRQLAASDSEKERRGGLSLWDYLVTSHRYAGPPFDELIILLESEKVNSVRGLIMPLLAQCTIDSNTDPDRVMDILLTFSTHKDVNLRDSAINAMLTVAFTAAASPAAYAWKLVDVILLPPVKGDLVNRFFRGMSDLPHDQSGLTINILERLITGCNEHLKHNAKQELYNDLIKPVRKIFRFSPGPAIKQLLPLVPQVEQHLGRLIVEAVCYECFMELIPELDRLLEHPGVPARVKESIRRHKFNRERTLGGDGWPELENLLSADSHPAPDAGHPPMSQEKLPAPGSLGNQEPLAVPQALSKKAPPVHETEHKNGLKRKILFLSANQAGEGRLFTDREYREIDASLRGSKYRHQFELIAKFAVRYTDFRQALLDHVPHLLHFSGHGTEDGLVILDEGGIFPEHMTTEVVSRLFELFSHHIQCVILSSCYSEQQAAAIVRHVPYVIGMKEGIEDNAAIEFSKGFYDALGAGRPIEDAFQLGCQGILHAFPELPRHLIPVLKKNVNGPSKTIGKNRQ